jgi:hypothetical protein
VLQVIAVLLILFALANVYFVWHGGVLAVRVQSRLMTTLFVVKFVVWITALWSALAAVRFLVGVPEILPLGGIGLGLILLAVNTLPAYIHLQMLAIERDGDEPTGPETTIQRQDRMVGDKRRELQADADERSGE